MSKMYKKIKAYYDSEFWNEVRIRNMVIKGVITKEEYKNIIGRNFKE